MADQMPQMYSIRNILRRKFFLRILPSEMSASAVVVCFILVTLIPNARLPIMALGIVYFYVMKQNDYWKQRGVPFMKPFLFFGNTLDITLQRSPAANVYEKIYNNLSGHKFGGFFNFTKPILMIRDPVLINAILVKEFSHFHDRSSFLEEERDSLSSHLLNMTGERWRKTRKQIMPAFSPSKVRSMQRIMRDCINELENYLLEDIENGTAINICEAMARLTTDIIGFYAFDLKCNALKDENCEYRVVEELICKSSYRTILRDVLRNLWPSLNHFWKLKGHDPYVDKFFVALFRKVTKGRKGSAEKKNDFFQRIIDLHASDPTFSEHAAAANGFFIFFAGFSTISSTLSYALYELSMQQELWRKLRKEVESAYDQDGNIDLESLKKLPYLDAVLSETLRKYSVFPSLQRQCRKDFEIPGTSITIEKGVNIIIPIHALHKDPEYWPNPDEFQPERFLEKNRHSIVSGTYLPFGNGPRGCFGKDFAKMEMKLVLAYFVANFNVEPSEQMVQPLQLVQRGVILSPKDGIKLRIQRVRTPQK